MKFFNIRANEIEGVSIYVNRAGFTGEKLGYEIYVPSDQYAWFEEKLKAAADKAGGKESIQWYSSSWFCSSICMA